MSQYDASKQNYQEVTIMGKPALFTDFRIDRTTVPEGVYRYELRHGDENWGEPVELARSIFANYYGTVLTREPFQLPVDGWIPMENDSLSFQDSGCRTLAEFQEKYPASEKDVIDFYSVNDPALHNLYFSRSEEQDKVVGCVGHLRGDFGSGKQFYTTWWPHQQDALNTPEFKADIDRTVNWLREQPDSPLRDFDSMNRYCNRYEQICAIKGALLPSCGFMVKTKRYRGLTLELAFDTFAREYRLTMIGQLRHTVTLGTDVFGNLQRMDNALEGLPIKEQACREQLSNLQTQLETAKAEVQKPFPRETELNTKTARLEELNTLLNLDHKEPEIVDAEPDEDQRPPERRRPQLER